MKLLKIENLADYEPTIAQMEALVEKRIAGKLEDQLWFVEHPPLYTAGTSAQPSEITNLQNLPVYKTGRGGRYTYHGPGQRVAYPIVNLNNKRKDVRLYIKTLESWVNASLHQIGISSYTNPERVGVWVDTNEGAKKIAAIGVRIRRWVAFHGISVNINPELANFQGIIPCGISEFGVTSLKELGVNITMNEFDAILTAEFEKQFSVKLQLQELHNLENMEGLQ